MQTLESRLAQLERSQNRLKLLSCFFGTMTVTMFFLAAERQTGAPVQDVVRAQRFELIGKNGDPLGGIASDSEGGSLVLKRTNQRGAITLVAGKDGGSVSLYGNSKNPGEGIIFNAGPDSTGSGSITLLGAAGKGHSEAKLSANANTCGLVATSENGKGFAYLRAIDSGGGLGLATDLHKTGEVHLLARADGGDLLLRTNAQSSYARLFITPESEAQLQLVGKKQPSIHIYPN